MEREDSAAGGQANDFLEKQKFPRLWTRHDIMKTAAEMQPQEGDFAMKKETKKSIIASAATLVGVGAVYLFGALLKKKK